MSGIAAPRTYKPGELIYSEEAFALTPPIGQEDKRCNRCCKRSDVLIPCDKCSNVQYCGKECQAKDLENHKVECGKLHIPLITEHDYFHLLLARVILRVKGKDWKSITKNILGTDISFDDLDSHYEEMTTHPKFTFLCEEIESDLKDSIGEENMPEKDDLIKIIGKVRQNNRLPFSTTSPLLFYFGYDCFKSECIPNAACDTCDNVLNIWAVKPIEAAEQITISKKTFLCYSPADELDDISPCKCTDCSLPYGESVLTKILDESKAFSVIKLSENALELVGVFSSLDLESVFVQGLRHMIVAALKLQEGVLGHTNALHLKLLAVRAMMIKMDDTERRLCFLELAEKLSAVFGEYFPELSEIYSELCMYSYSQGDTTKAHEYKNKMQIIEKYRKPASENQSRELSQEQTIVKSLEQQLLNF